MNSLNIIGIKSLVAALSQLPSALPRDKQAELNYLGRAIALDVTLSHSLDDFVLNYSPLAQLYAAAKTKFELNQSESNLVSESWEFNLLDVVNALNNAPEGEFIKLVTNVLQAYDSVKAAQIELQELLQTINS